MYTRTRSLYIQENAFYTGLGGISIQDLEEKSAPTGARGAPAPASRANAHTAAAGDASDDDSGGVPELEEVD